MNIFSRLFSAAPDQKNISLEMVLQAADKIRKFIPFTPLTHAPNISELTEHDVFFKWDNKLKTGSFKERGALNFLLNMPESAKQKGVCAASAGNHALALSFYAEKLQIPCTIVMPRFAPIVKIQLTKKRAANVILAGDTLEDAFLHAREIAKVESKSFVHAYDDPLVISGQGTLALELIAQLDDFDSLVVPVGGGGLISGIAAVIREKRPDVYILGVQSEWAVNFRKLTEQNRPTIIPATVADGIAVKVPGSITQPIIDRTVNQMVSVSETEIASAIVRFLELEKTVVEGAAAVGLAALLCKKLPRDLKKTVVVVSGSNIDISFLSRLIERDMRERGRLLRLLVSVPDRPGTLNITSSLIAKENANVLQVFHDRSGSLVPGNVDIAFLLEVRDEAHKSQVIESLKQHGLAVREVLDPI